MLAARGEIREDTLLETADTPERDAGKYFQAVELEGLFVKAPIPEPSYPSRTGLEFAIAVMEFLRVFMLAVYIIVAIAMFGSGSFTHEPLLLLPLVSSCVLSYVFTWLLLTILIHWSRIFMEMEKNTLVTAFYLRKQIEAERNSHKLK